MQKKCLSRPFLERCVRCAEKNSFVTDEFLDEEEIAPGRYVDDDGKRIRISRDNWPLRLQTARVISHIAYKKKVAQKALDEANEAFEKAPRKELAKQKKAQEKEDKRQAKAKAKAEKAAALVAKRAATAARKAQTLAGRKENGEPGGRRSRTRR